MWSPLSSVRARHSPSPPSASAYTMSSFQPNSGETPCYSHNSCPDRSTWRTSSCAGFPVASLTPIAFTRQSGEQGGLHRGGSDVLKATVEVRGLHHFRDIIKSLCRDEISRLGRDRSVKAYWSCKGSYCQKSHFFFEISF